ncbi:Crp/Fnr family transcriptional regulator [Streptomyces nondiastaticus]|uniref:Crp/Fnr family transcriptional regulator n=1 Tax=Streptomyces nondiastaticus TaxID=3154512 RepID=UPI00341DFE3C
MMRSSNTRDRAQFLHMLSDRASAALAQLGSQHRYAVGDVLIHEDDRAEELVVLRKGLVKVTVRVNDNRVSLMDIRIAGDVVGEMAAVDPGPRSATVTACGDVLATVIPRQELLPFLHDNPEVSLALNRVLVGRLRRSDRWRLTFGEYPVLVRLARVLVELAMLYGRQERNAVRIPVNLSQSEFAALTGSKLRTVQEALAQLRNDGLITTGCRQTYVRDLVELGKVARLRVAPPRATGN